MVISIDKENKIEVKGPVALKASKGFELIVKSTDCEVDTDLGKVIIRCNKFSVKERKAHKGDSFVI